MNMIGSRDPASSTHVPTQDSRKAGKDWSCQKRHCHCAAFLQRLLSSTDHLDGSHNATKRWSACCTSQSFTSLTTHPYLAICLSQCWVTGGFLTHTGHRPSGSPRLALENVTSHQNVSCDPVISMKLALHVDDSEGIVLGPPIRVRTEDMVHSDSVE